MTPEEHIEWLIEEQIEGGPIATEVAASIIKSCSSVPPEPGFPRSTPGLLPLPGGNNAERVTYRRLAESTVAELAIATEFMFRLVGLHSAETMALQDMLDCVRFKGAPETESVLEALYMRKMPERRSRYDA